MFTADNFSVGSESNKLVGYIEKETTQRQYRTMIKLKKSFLTLK